MDSPLYFEASDLETDDLPAPGSYPGVIGSARVRRSGQGNLMLEVFHELDGMPPSHDRIPDYFVLEGAPRAVAVARARLVRLYRACGLAPKKGDPIEASDLVDGRLVVEVDHDEWRGRRRLRVVGYRPSLGWPGSGDPTPF